MAAPLSPLLCKGLYQSITLQSLSWRLFISSSRCSHRDVSKNMSRRRFHHCLQNGVASRSSQRSILGGLHRNNGKMLSAFSFVGTQPLSSCYRRYDNINYYFSTAINSNADTTKSNNDVTSSSTAAAEQRITETISSSNNNNIESSSSLFDHYESLIASGEVTRDPHQIRALRELDRLRADCLAYIASPSFNSNSANNNATSKSDGDSGGWSISNLFSSWGDDSSSSTSTASSGSHQVQAATIDKPKGVYLHGGVGCGKTYCMDLFYNSLPANPLQANDDLTTAEANSSTAQSSNSNNKNNIKQKVHFHKFMLNMHKSIHTAKTTHKLQGADLINHVIHDTLSHGKIICFDEFQVTDIADALLLKRLFTSLLAKGAVIVATSNRPPCDLYKGGLQRDLFLPFIDLLEDECHVVSMWESDMDYRLVQKDEEDDSYDDSGKQRVYFVGNDGAKRRFEKLFHVLTKGSDINSMVLDVQGRQVFVPKASEEYSIARFSFNDLCAKAAGAADYLAIGERFHTVFIEDVPKLQYHEVNLVRRWITLIDAMYENHVKLVIQAETKPEEMFEVDLENEHCDEVFAFDRTRSRMEEMRSEKYLQKKWLGHLQLRDDVGRARQIDYMQ